MRRRTRYRYPLLTTSANGLIDDRCCQVQRTQAVGDPGCHRHWMYLQRSWSFAFLVTVQPPSSKPQPPTAELRSPCSASALRVGAGQPAMQEAVRQGDDLRPGRGGPCRTCRQTNMLPWAIPAPYYPCGTKRTLALRGRLSGSSQRWVGEDEGATVERW